MQASNRLVIKINHLLNTGHGQGYQLKELKILTVKHCNYRHLTHDYFNHYTSTGKKWNNARDNINIVVKVAYLHRFNI